MKYRLLSFKSFSVKEQQGIFELIASAGEVPTGRLKERLDLAQIVGAIFNGEVITSTATIKMPSRQYVDKILMKSYNEKFGGIFFLELGYVCTSPEYRGQGLALKLISQLIEKYSSNNLYATTRTDNKGMIRILEIHGFSLQGTPYLSENKEYHLCVYFRLIQSKK